VGGPHSEKTNVPIARRLATGRMNAPAIREQHQSLTKLLQEKKTGWQPELEAQDLIGLTRIESD
jgi:hypothetical protein